MKAEVISGVYIANHDLDMLKKRGLKCGKAFVWAKRHGELREIGSMHWSEETGAPTLVEGDEMARHELTGNERVMDSF